jgi:hypothetical protein
MKFGASFLSDVFLCVHSSAWCQVTEINKLVSFKTTGNTVTKINLEVTIQISKLITKTLSSFILALLY